mgnify:CR=1 FL=1
MQGGGKEGVAVATATETTQQMKNQISNMAVT